MDFVFSNRIAPVNGSATREILKLLAEKPDVISFAGGLPASPCLPISEINRAMNKLLTSDRAITMLQYGTTQGFVSTRNAFLDFLKGSGITGLTAENALIVSGGQQGIELMCKCFLNEGDVMLVEDPTYLAALQIAQSYGAKSVGVRANDDGLDIADLEAKILKFKPKFLYVVPTFSNPTGKTYTTENRKAIAELTAKYNLPVLEDDPYSRLRFEGEPVPALKTFDLAGNIVHVASMSKVISPGLRIAVMVGDKAMIRKLEVAKQGADVHSSHFSQLIVEELINSGELKASIERNVPLYLGKKKYMQAMLDKFMPAEYRYYPTRGGIFIWGEVDADIDTAEILKEAINRKVAYVQGSVFYADGSGKNTLRLNFSNADEEKIERGIHALGDLYKEVLAKK